MPSAPRVEAAEPEPPPTVLSIDDLITQDAAKFHVSRQALYDTLKCESAGFKDVAIRGDHGLARGLSQIRSDYHSEVTDAQADDPAFAIVFMAKAFSENKAYEWTCARNLGYAK